MENSMYCIFKKVKEVCNIINDNVVLPVYKTNGEIPYGYGIQAVSPIDTGLVSVEKSIQKIVHEKCGMTLLYRLEILKGELLAELAKGIMNRFFGKNICHVELGDYCKNDKFETIMFTFEVHYKK